MSTSTKLAKRRDEFLGAGTTLFYKEPVHLVRGEGIALFDPDGRRYVDMYNNVPCVGHCHPHVVEAISRQAATLNVHSRYLHEGVVDYAERLTSKHHDGIENAIFTCTGTEANEVALLMARAATGGQGIICSDWAYHGNSTEVRKLTNQRSNDGDVRSIPFPDTYRYDGSGDAGEFYLGKLEEVIASFKRDGIPLAGMLVCSIFANEGLPNVPAGFMARAVELVHEAGGLFIADEVQAGLCRTGQWWGYQDMGIKPDIVTMGKPIGAGVPLSAVAASRELVESFRQDTHYFNTFASSPLQAAAGNAVLDVIENESVRENVNEVGQWLLERLKDVQQRCESMGDLRGLGLFIGMEWVKDRQSKTPDVEGAERVAESLKTKGFLISNAGAHDNVLKVRPPLVFSKSDGEAFLEAFDATLDELYG
jgi:4-aminobutyrate aminotransferase-like enzyme